MTENSGPSSPRIGLLTVSAFNCYIAPPHTQTVYIGKTSTSTAFHHMLAARVPGKFETAIVMFIPVVISHPEPPEDRRPGI